jgi:signal transduction histidine kinase
LRQRPEPEPTSMTAAARHDGVEGRASDREEGGRFRVRLGVPSWRWRTTRDALAARDAERERLADDLRDGVQQQLTALRVRLRLAAGLADDRGESESGAVLRKFGDDLDGAIDDMRDLAHGIYPWLLTKFGAVAALAAAGDRSSLPVTVHGSGVRRCRAQVEVAVYFSCLAALDNAAKHAGPAPVLIELSDTGSALNFTVSDPGTGFAPADTQLGAGIANMRDRIASVGGSLAVDSAPGRGTRVHGSVPNPGWR